jgi:hypothetical protein
MKPSNATLCLFALLGTGSLAAAANPFDGIWKLDQQKSHLTGDTMTFADAGSGTIKFSALGMSYTFKTDGKEYPALFGNTAAWKQVDKSTWEETIYKKSGTVLSTDTLKLSADGRTLTVESKGTKPSGESFDNTSIYQRMSGQGRLVGTWKSKAVKISSPATLKFKTSGENGMTLNIPDFKATCEAKFDGKDYPATGPTVPDGLTLALTRTGPHSFRMVQKLKGKPLFTDRFTVSADGKSMTDLSRPVAVNEPATLVYEKQ